MNPTVHKLILKIIKKFSSTRAFSLSLWFPDVLEKSVIRNYCISLHNRCYSYSLLLPWSRKWLIGLHSYHWGKFNMRNTDIARLLRHSHEYNTKFAQSLNRYYVLIIEWRSYEVLFPKILCTLYCSRVWFVSFLFDFIVRWRLDTCRKYLVFKQ